MNGLTDAFDFHEHRDITRKQFPRFDQQILPLKAASIQARNGASQNGEADFLIRFLTALNVVLFKLATPETTIINTPLRKPVEADIWENFVPMVLCIDSERRLSDLLEKVRLLVEESYLYQNYPLDLVNRSDSGESTTFSNILVKSPGLHATGDKALEEKHDLIIEILHGEHISLVCKFNEAVFSSDFIRRLMTYCEEALSGLNGDDVPVQKLNILGGQ